MSGFTRLGCDLWNWEPFVALDYEARQLWLAFYTSSNAKRTVPGLWQGGIPTMGEAARMPSDHVVRALDTLLSHEMVEYDPKTRVLRFTAADGNTPFPDTGEFPFNGNAVRGWWNKFVTVTACAVRDAHVVTLRWLMDAGAYQTKTRRLSHDHEDAWKDTFKQVPIPASRRRGVRRLMDDDTSTSVQPSLFGSAPSKALMPGPGTVPDQQMNGTYPQGAGSDRFSTIRHTLKPFETIQDQDQVQDLSSLSGSGTGRPLFEASEAPARSPAGVVLRLVPPSTDPWTADEMIGAIAETASGLVPLALTQTRRLALQRAIPHLTASGWGLNELRVLGQFLGSHATTAAGWLAWIDKGDLAEAVLEARSWYQSHGITPAAVTTPA